MSTPTGAHDSVVQRVWHGMRVLVLDVDDRRHEVADATGMSFARSKALRRLTAGPLTMRALATSLGTDPPYTTLIVDDLEGLGLVERSVNPGDRRSKLVTVTAAGIAVADLAEGILDRPPTGLTEIDPADLAVVDRVIRRLLAGHEL